MNVPCYLMLSKILSLPGPQLPDTIGVSNHLQVLSPALRLPDLSLLER